MFSGCDTDNINNSPQIPILYTPANSVKSVWFYEDEDPSNNWYIAITDTTYTEYMPSKLDGETDMNDDELNTGKDAIVYFGTIAETTNLSQSTGFIYVKLDDSLKSSEADEYFAVRWENYTGTGIKLYSSYTNGGVQSTLAAAKSTYNTSYDDNWENLVPYTKVNVRVPLKGDLSDSAWGGTVEITDITYADYMDTQYYSGVTYSGIIVGTTNPVQSEGYIYIKYATSASYEGGSVAGNYYAIHWKNHTNDTIDLSGAGEGAGKTTLDEARKEYTVANGYFTYYTTFNK
ncbi:MAG: hypothetical protein LBQ88_19285 [Treponema sp.]|nr:hypothetical protein [Treponema sp.]